MRTVDTIADRIQLKIHEKGCKQADIVRVTGATKGAVSKWVSGVNTPKGESLLKLATFLNTNTSWLLTGKGSDEKNLHDSDFSGVVAWEQGSPLDDDEFEIPYFAKVIVNEVNKDKVVHQTDGTTVRISKSAAIKAGANIHQSFSYINDGDSMNERILDGARCTADASKTEIKDGKIYCFRHGLMRRTKFLSWLPDGGLLIKSCNSAYKDEIVSHDDLGDIEILGWVWEWSNLERW